MSSGNLLQLEVEAAIERVLAAEAAAMLAVRNAEIEAQHRLEAARARARRIAEHTSERLQRISLRINADCARDVARIAATAAKLTPDIEHDSKRLILVIEALVADLTGGPG